MSRVGHGVEGTFFIQPGEHVKDKKLCFGIMKNTVDLS